MQKQAAIEEESSKGLSVKHFPLGRFFTGQTLNSDEFIAETQDELDKLIKAKLEYEKEIEEYKETGFGLGSIYEGVVPGY